MRFSFVALAAALMAVAAAPVLAQGAGQSGLQKLNSGRVGLGAIVERNAATGGVTLMREPKGSTLDSNNFQRLPDTAGPLPAPVPTPLVTNDYMTPSVVLDPSPPRAEIYNALTRSGTNR